MHFREVFTKESEKRHLSAEPDGCGLSEQHRVRKESADPSDNPPLSAAFLQPLCLRRTLFFLLMASPFPRRYPRLSPRPLTQHLRSPALLRQSLGTSPTVTADGEGAEERGMAQDCKGAKRTSGRKSVCCS